MRLGISTACFYPQPLEEILPMLAKFGVRAVEIFFNTESEFSPAFLDGLGAQARALAIDIVSIHPYTSLMEGMMLFSDYARRTEDGMMQYQRYFESAARLGARYVTFHGERDLGGTDTPARVERRLEGYRRLCALASSCGVMLAQENVAWCRSKEPSFVRTLYDAVPALRYTLDIKQARRAGQDWRDFAEVMGERLVNVHINDFGGTQSCLLPGDGEMNYRGFFSRLGEMHYVGHVLIEVYRTNFDAPSDVRRAINALAPYAAL